MSENITGRYFKYAIGEIILVVIGILIALQINNWNEHRKRMATESLLLADIIEDLKLDFQELKVNDSLLSIQEDVVKLLIKNPNDSFLSKSADLSYLRFWATIHPVTFADNIPDGIQRRENIELLKTYQRSQQRVLESNKFYGTVILQLVRPFLRKHGVHNIDGALVPVDAVEVNLIDYDTLKEQFGSVGFREVLFELHLKLREFRYYLKTLMEETEKLVPILKSRIQ
ncbi:DUF6090 family protein [Winogradskyella maritima]|uniref:DUF6090 family protein n=2 Tax=Winogradskyella maritima TaxID=1517766 RepID=A0ABV8AKR7_9FLAO|nr:DUF6090 family protein [Winogradskyella maritima]